MPQQARAVSEQIINTSQETKMERLLDFFNTTGLITKKEAEQTSLSHANAEAIGLIIVGPPAVESHFFHKTPSTTTLIAINKTHLEQVAPNAFEIIARNAEKLNLFRNDLGRFTFPLTEPQNNSAYRARKRANRIHKKRKHRHP